jgi:hypothetical protein
MFRRLLFLFALLAGTATVAADQPPLHIEFDGKVGANPASPAAGQVKTSGTFKVPPGQKFQKIDITVALRGMSAKGKQVGAATLDKAIPNAWSAVVENLDEAGEYEVEAHLYTRDAQGQDKVYETRDTRRVYVSK